MEDLYNLSSLSTQLWLIGSILLVTAIGLYFSRKMLTKEDFYIAGMKIPAPVVAFSMAATSMSGWGYVGGPGGMFEDGMGAMPILEVSALLGILCSYFIIASPMRQLAETHGALTAPDLGEILYKSQAVRLVFASGVIIGVTAYLAANFLAVGTVIHLVFGVPELWGLFIGASVVIFYSLAGGQSGAMWVDFIQGVIMVFGAILAIYFIYANLGGYGHVLESLASSDQVAENYLSIFRDNYLMIFSYIVVFGIGYMGLPQILTKFYTIKSRNFLKWALPMTLVVYSLMFSFEFTGLATRYGVISLGWPEVGNSDNSVYVFINELFPAALQGVLYAVIVSAILSTANSLIVVGGSAFALDIYQRWFWPRMLKSNPRYDFNEVRLARIGALIFSLIAIVMVIDPPALIVWIGALGWGIMAATILVPVLAGLYWKRATAQGAFLAGIMGLVVSLTTGIADVGYDIEIYAHSGFWGIVASLVTMGLVSLMTSRRDAV